MGSWQLLGVMDACCAAGLWTSVAPGPGQAIRGIPAKRRRTWNPPSAARGHGAGAQHFGQRLAGRGHLALADRRDRKSTRLNSSHLVISYAVFCLKKKKTQARLLTRICSMAS